MPEPEVHARRPSGVRRVSSAIIGRIRKFDFGPFLRAVPAETMTPTIVPFLSRDPNATSRPSKDMIGPPPIEIRSETRTGAPPEIGILKI